MICGNENGEVGVWELSVVINGMCEVGVFSECLEFDVLIVCGLDYYIGMIFEIFFDDLF